VADAAGRPPGADDGHRLGREQRAQRRPLRVPVALVDRPQGLVVVGRPDQDV
jgi:hypothetical protein